MLYHSLHQDHLTLRVLHRLLFLLHQFISTIGKVDATSTLLFSAGNLTPFCALLYFTMVMYLKKTEEWTVTQKKHIRPFLLLRRIIERLQNARMDEDKRLPIEPDELLAIVQMFEESICYEMNMDP